MSDETDGRGARPLAQAEERAAELVHDEPERPYPPVGPDSAGGAGAGPFKVTALWRYVTAWRSLRSTPYGLRPLFVLGWAAFFVGLSEAVLTLASVDIIQDLDVDLGTVINYSVLVGTVAVIAILFVAHYVDRHPRLRVFTGGMIVGSLLGAVAGRARSGLSFGAPLIASDTALSVAATPVSSLLADYYPVYERGKAYALNGLFFAVGGAIAPLLAGELIDAFGWRTTYVVLAVPVAVVGVLGMLRLREPVRGYMERRALGAEEEVATLEDEPPSFAEAWRTIWGIKTLRRIFMAGIFTSTATRMYSLAAILIWLPREYGLDPREIGRAFAISAAFGIPGFLIAGALVDSFMRRRPSQVLTLAGVFGIIAAAATAVLPLRPPLWVFVLSQGVVFFGGSLLGPAQEAFYAQIVPSHTRTLGVAVQRLSVLPGRIFGTPLLGILILNYGVQSALFFTVPIALIGSIIFLTSAPFFEVDMRSALATSVARDEWRKARKQGRDKLLVCRDVDVEYDGVQVLFGVDFDVAEGEIVALLGTNGAGKSTLLKAISGAHQASSGAIVFDGRDITYMPPNETAGRGVVLMPGGRGVFPGLTVRENLLLGNWLNDDEADVRARLEEVFEVFPALAARAGADAGTLSGGEQQMLSLAQAFLARPRVLMIDELSLGLSPAVVAELLDVVRRIHDRGVTVIVVEQSVNVALQLADRAIFMEKGEVRFVGPTAELLERPEILRAVYVKGTGALTEGGVSARRRDQLTDARPVLEAEGIVKRFGGVVALDEVSLQLRDGEVLGVIGPNGSGKTTLFDIISGFQVPDRGLVRYQGVDVSHLSPDARARQGLVRRFQDARLFPSLTVFENLLIALDQRLETRSTLLNAVSFPQARRAERRVRIRAERLVELLELGAYRDKFVRELSTGLRRITDLACVLATEPSVLLLDEPSSGIAQAEAEGLGPLLRRVRYETGCSMMIIEHDMPLISATADELVALDQGQVVVRGTADEVLEDERVVAAYLGSAEAAVRRSGSLT